MDNKQIENWILEGFTDDEIQVKLDKIEELSHAPSKEAVIALNEQSDDVAPAPGPAKDGVQEMFNRTIAAIDKTYDKADNNESDIIELNKGEFDVNGDGTKITKIFDDNGDLDVAVKDLTHLKTQDEIYNVAYNSSAKAFIVPYGSGSYFGFMVIKDANQIIFECLTGAIGVFRFRQLTVKKGSNTALPTIGYSKVSGGAPTTDDDYTTKKYVDDSQTIKDLTHLTTEDEVYQAIDMDKLAMIKIGEDIIIMTPQNKTATSIDLFGSKYVSGNNSGAIYSPVHAGNTHALSVNSTIPYEVGTPSHDNHATTKHYVDTEIAKIPTGGGAPTWKDITTSYQTRVWTDADVGKRVKIHNNMGAIVVATLNKVFDLGKNAVTYAAQGWTNTPNSSQATAVSLMWFEGTNLYGDTIVPPSRPIKKFEIEEA